MHGDIAISKEEQSVLDSPYLQRLRYIYQNSASYLVYPCATGNRFIHSLGVMDLATQMFKSAIENTREQYPDGYEEFIKFCTNDRMKKTFGIEIPENEIMDFLLQTLRFAALLHDVGHLPFSHATEDVFAKILRLKETFLMQLLEIKAHEVIGLDVIRKLDISNKYKRSVILTLFADIYDVIMERCPSILQKEVGETFRELTYTPFYTLKKILSYVIDADRGDYLLRDGKISGVGFGFYDLDRLLYSLYLEKWGDRFLILPAERAQSTLESFITERYKLYRYVYLHKKVLLFNKILENAIERLNNQGEFSTLKEKHIKKENSIELSNFFRSLIDYLKGINENIPHFMRGGNFYVDPSFLIKGGDGYFLDDYWLLIKLRQTEIEEESIEGKYLKLLVQAFHRLYPFHVIYKNKTEEAIFTQNLLENLLEGEFGPELKKNELKGKKVFSKFFNAMWEDDRWRNDYLKPWLEKAKTLLEKNDEKGGILIWAGSSIQKCWGKIKKGKIEEIAEKLLVKLPYGEPILFGKRSSLIRSIMEKVENIWNEQETALWLGFVPFNKNCSREEAKQEVMNALKKACKEIMDPAILKRLLGDLTHY